QSATSVCPFSNPCCLQETREVGRRRRRREWGEEGGKGRGGPALTPPRRDRGATWKEPFADDQNHDINAATTSPTLCRRSTSTTPRTATLEAEPQAQVGAPLLPPRRAGTASPRHGHAILVSVEPSDPRKSRRIRTTLTTSTTLKRRTILQVRTWRTNPDALEGLCCFAQVLPVVKIEDENLKS
ncbi:unnamed protein product, partial [Urochloa humidicola]